jgi:6-pyruvoyl-tetrahydropterin synthase
MGRFYDQTKFKEVFLSALKGDIQFGPNAHNFPAGVVEISEFKFHYIVFVEPNDFLPTSEELMHLHMWDHLKDRLPRPILSEIEDMTSQMIHDLIEHDVLTLGGRIGTSEFNGDNYAVRVSVCS